MGKKDNKILVQQGKAQDLVVSGGKGGLAELMRAAQREEDSRHGGNGGRGRGMFDEFARYNYKPRLGDLDGFGQLKARRLEAIMRELEERRHLGLDVEGDMMAEISRLSHGMYELAERVPVDPNSADGLQQLIDNALSRGLNAPFMLCMTQRTWSEFISVDAKEFIVELMDAGAVEVSIDPSAPDKAIYLKEKNA